MKFVKGDRVVHRKFGSATVEETLMRLHPGLGDEYVFICPDVRLEGHAEIVLVDVEGLEPERR